jgi:hypothetical protein
VITVPKFQVIGPYEDIMAGPLRSSEHPARSLKGKGNTTKFLEMGEVEGSETFGCWTSSGGPISNSLLTGSSKKN